MKTSFNAAIAAPTENTNAPAVVEQKQIVPVAVVNTSDVDDLEGEIGRNDVRLPRLNLVARTGDLAELFAPGSYVLNKEVKLSKGTGDDFLTIVVLRLRKQYQESLPYGDPTPARVYDTAEEVRANGGTVAYGKGAGIFGEIAHMELLIQAPENVSEEADGHFFFEADGVRYTHCAFTVGATAYSAVAKPIISARMNHLRDTGLAGGKWALGSVLKKANGNSWYIPTIKTDGMTTEKFREDVKNAL